MSRQLIQARKQLTTINSKLKGKRHMSAVQSVHDAALAIVNSSLMKNEKEEFQKLLENAVFHLNQDKGLREVYPLILKYEKGGEKRLIQDLRGLLKDLQEQINKEAQAKLAAIEEKKEEDLKKGENMLQQQQYGEARGHFDKMVAEHDKDTDLKASIADKFLHHEQYQDAYDFLEEALDTDPEAIHLYNKIAVVLRKMKDYSTVEDYFKRALRLAPNDEYLYFNAGRLYVDTEQWKMVARFADRAIKINPNFDQAKKMLQFALKKIKKSQ
ncbi:MAG: hypothetical protein ACNI27_11975 [Desulfovibrio sp.]